MCNKLQNKNMKLKDIKNEKSFICVDTTLELRFYLDSNYTKVSKYLIANLDVQGTDDRGYYIANLYEYLNDEKIIKHAKKELLYKDVCNSDEEVVRRMFDDLLVILELGIEENSEAFLDMFELVEKEKKQGGEE